MNIEITSEKAEEGAITGGTTAGTNFWHNITQMEE